MPPHAMPPHAMPRTCARSFGDATEFLGGLSAVTGGGALLRSIEEEFRANEGGKWLDEYTYVAEQSAEENPGHLPSTAKFLGAHSTSGEEIVRDRGHAGMSLQSFCDVAEAKLARLSVAEVCALRLYTGPVYAALNAALRQQRIGDWATTIA